MSPLPLRSLEVFVVMARAATRRACSAASFLGTRGSRVSRPSVKPGLAAVNPPAEVVPLRPTH
jgi:hypothetical protein